MDQKASQQCINPRCGQTFGLDEVLFACPRCGSLLDVRYDWSLASVPKSLSVFDARRGVIGSSPQVRADYSGVWRFRELLPFADLDELVTVGEGRTMLQQADELAREIGLRPGNLFLQYEGFNPSGSFKDNGMAAAFTIARKLGRSRVACASTGNTSASMAMFARLTPVDPESSSMRAAGFSPRGRSTSMAPPPGTTARAEEPGNFSPSERIPNTGNEGKSASKWDFFPGSEARGSLASQDSESGLRASSPSNTGWKPVPHTMQAIVFVGGDKIAFGKLAQALDYGATTIQVRGDFDACMSLVQQASQRLGLYLMNSVNPFRLEGQKTIMYRVLEGLDWEPPDWIVVPGGNLGNSSAFGKAFMELAELGLVKRVPRLAIINAQGANTLFELHNQHGVCFRDGAVDQTPIDAYYARRLAEGRAAKTVASAIEIGRPVNLVKALRSLAFMNGVVREVSDEAILDGKALVGRYGYGCEPASGASIAGLRLLIEERVIAPSDRVVCVLTGHALKDPNVTVDYHRRSGKWSNAAFANPPLQVDANVEAIAAILDAGVEERN